MFKMIRKNGSSQKVNASRALLKKPLRLYVVELVYRLLRNGVT